MWSQRGIELKIFAQAKLKILAKSFKPKQIGKFCRGDQFFTLHKLVLQSNYTSRYQTKRHFFKGNLYIFFAHAKQAKDIFAQARLEWL